MTRPNFLVICVDQMRADHMGCAGNRVIRTPNLDRLAASGVHFPRAYVNNPVCMPSRATMFTGMTPRGHGVRGNGIALNPAIPTMPGALAAAGYQTASIGKLHMGPYGLHQETNAPRDPAMFPECIAFWNSKQITQIPTPFYGFQHVDITLGHSGGTNGNWRHWLQREHPAAFAALNDRKQWKPSPLGAENCATLPLDEDQHHTAYVANRTIDFLRTRDASRPFFAWCSFPDPHHAYHVPRGWDNLYKPEDVVPPVSREGEFDDLPPFMRKSHDESQLLGGRMAPTKMSMEHRREILAYTYSMVTLLDKHIGRLLDTLAELSLDRDTVVVFISDHGDLMGDHNLLNKGPFHFEGLVRVPMIWRIPGGKASRAAALASLLDFAPTILDLAGVPIPEGFTSPESPGQGPAWPGRSLAPVLRGESPSVQDSVLIEYNEDYLGLKLRTLVTPTHKLTTYTHHRGAKPWGELFDLTNDPHELRNLYHRPEARALRARLTEELHHRIVETDINLPRRLSHA